jgi:hypothetical protein
MAWGFWVMIGVVLVGVTTVLANIKTYLEGPNETPQPEIKVELISPYPIPPPEPEKPPSQTSLTRPRAEHFTGRRKEIKKLLADLQPDAVITITGPGGMGKTALAAEALHRLTENGSRLPEAFPGGILAYSFYGRPQVAQALEFILRQYGLDPKPTPEEAAAALFSQLNAILVLDGAEQADHLDTLIDIHGRTCLLITSRSRGDVHQQHQDLPPLETGEGQILLYHWAKDCIDDPSAAEQINELVGGLPLAIRIASKYLLTKSEPATNYLLWLRSTPLKALDHGLRSKDSIPILLEKSLRLNIQNFGPKHHSVTQTLNNLGYLMNELGKYYDPY